MNEQSAQRAPIPHPPPQGNVPPTRARAGGQIRPAYPAGGKTRAARRDGDDRHARGVATAAGGARIHGSRASTAAAEGTKGRRGGTTKLTKHTKKGRHIKDKKTRGGQALTLTAIWQARLERVASSASWHERMVNGRAAASGEKRIHLSETIAWFGDMLNRDGPLVEIGPRSIFGNSAVIRSIFSTCNALGQDGLPTLPDVPPSVCYPSGRHRQRRRPKPGGQRNLDPRIGRERA